MQVSCNLLYGSDFSQVKLSAGRSSGCVSHVSSSSSSGGGGRGAALSSKTRIRWTQELHDRFVECVNRLGGAESMSWMMDPYFPSFLFFKKTMNLDFVFFLVDHLEATPKAILRLMDWEGLTIFHVKSHLQVLMCK